MSSFKFIDTQILCWIAKETEKRKAWFERLKMQSYKCCGYYGFPLGGPKHPCPCSLRRPPKKDESKKGWIEVDFNTCLQSNPCLHAARWQGFGGVTFGGVTDGRKIVDKYQEYGLPVPEHFHYLLSDKEKNVVVKVRPKKEKEKETRKKQEPASKVLKPMKTIAKSKRE